MVSSSIDEGRQQPLLYYKTKEDIEDYLKKPIEQKMQWIEAQMEFYHKAMPNKAKRIRDKLQRGEL